MYLTLSKGLVQIYSLHSVSVVGSFGGRPPRDISFWPPNFAFAGAAVAAAFSLTLFGKLYICQSVSQSVIQSARAIFALPLPSESDRAFPASRPPVYLSSQT